MTIADSSTQKRGRGRPPKSKEISKKRQEKANPSQKAEPLTNTRSTQPNVSTQSISQDESQKSSSSVRKRGRPRKDPSLLKHRQPKVPGRGRGRPRKEGSTTITNTSGNYIVASASEKAHFPCFLGRGRGRPRKDEATEKITKQPSNFLYIIQLFNCFIVSLGTRGRGRPPKSLKVALTPALVKKIELANKIIAIWVTKSALVCEMLEIWSI